MSTTQAIEVRLNFGLVRAVLSSVCLIQLKFIAKNQHDNPNHHLLGCTNNLQHNELKQHQKIKEKRKDQHSQSSYQECKLWNKCVSKTFHNIIQQQIRNKCQEIQNITIHHLNLIPENILI